MRILMWFTVGFAAACALAIYLGLSPWICLLVIPLAAYLFLLKNKKTNVIAVVLIGLAAGMLWTALYNHFYLDIARKYDGQTVGASATVSDFSYETDYGVAADAQTVLDGKTFKLRLYYPQKTSLQPGDRIEGKFRFRMTTDDSQQGGTYHQGNGIFLLAYVDEEATVTYSSQKEAKYFAVYLRKDIAKLLMDAFPADTVAFATALLLGDSSLLEYETDTNFKLSGIRHVIAVSGLHVSILMSVVYLFTCRQRYLSAIIGIPVLFVFAAVVGFTPSVVRACVMQALLLIGLFLNKEYDPPTALAFSVLVMLGINPVQIVSVSFQLSCGCLLGIFLFYEPCCQFLLGYFKPPKGKNRKSTLIRGFCSSVSITLSTMLTTTPLSAAYFGTVSIVGVLTNLLTLWVISFIFCGIGLACIAGLLWMPLAKIIGWVISIPIRYVIGVSGFLADLPIAAVYTCSIYVMVWIVMCYVLLTFFLLGKRKHPWLLSGCVVAGLVLAVALSWLEPVKGNYRVTVYDVGQGQSVLIECHEKRYLIDCGGDSSRTAADTVSQQLLSRGITSLDGIFVTHYDEDHAGGVPLLLTSISSDTLYLPDIEDNGGIRTALEQTHSNIHWIDQYSELEWENMKFTLIPGEHEKDDNERSLCILFQTENCDILITGDRSAAGEKALIEAARLPELELLVAGHHGSATATSLELLTVTRPKAAVISVSADNSYGHPSKDVLYRLKLFGTSIWRTDLDGTVVFEG